MAKPKLILIPSNQGSKINTVLPTDGSGDFDFSRASKATVINEYGLIENVDDGVSRLEYPLIDGVVSGCPSLLLEPARTNLIPYSEDFENSDWTKNAGTTITNNYAISPDGSLNASRYLGTGASGLGDKFTLSATSYTISFYVKSNTSENQLCRVIGDSSNISSDLLVTTEWTRLSYTFTGSGLSSKTNGIFRDSDDNDIDILIWGAQLEEGSYPTSYIPTNGAAVTRAAETANGSGDASTFNDSEGVLMAEVSALDVAAGETISINTGNNTQKIFLSLLDKTTVRYYVQGSGGNAFSDISIPSTSNFNKIAIKYKSTDFGIWINGFELYTSTSAITFSNLSSLDFYNPYLGGTENFYGNTKQLQYFETVLTDSELEQLTSWTSFTDMAQAQQYSIK